MRIIRLFLIWFSFHIGNKCQAQEDVLKTKLCKTWVAYQEIIHEPMIKTIHTQGIKELNKDSIILKSDHSILRYTRDTLYYGKWEFSKDTSGVVFNFENCINCYYSRETERFILNSLTDTTIEMCFNCGKEGEWTQRLFKQSK